MRSASIATAREINSLKQATSWGRRLILGASGGILVFAPLAYGAVHPWAYFTVGLAAAALSLALLAAGLYQMWVRPPGKWLWPYPPIWWLGVGLGLLILLQVTPWPQGLVRWLSPGAWEVRALGNGFGLAGYLPLSLNPNATLLEGWKLWPALVLFFVIIYTVNTRRQLQGLVGLILAVAFFEVLYGFWHFQTHLIWGWPNPHTRSRLCGTFINSNHLAGLLTMAILLGWGLFLAQRKTVSPLPGDATGWGRLQRWSRPEHLEPQFRRFPLLFLLLFLTVGLIFTGSRGGMISLVMGFALMALLIWGQRWKKGHIYLMAVFLAAAVLYSLFLGSAQVLVRFQDLTDEGRYHAMKGALTIFREYPLTGSGVATFGEVYYRYQPAKFKEFVFNYTHSDWLQLLAETGLVGFLFVLTAWLAFFSSLVKHWRQRRDTFARGLGLGGLAALGAAVFHSLGEFPFHIPGVILIFASIAAITYLTVHHHHQGGLAYSSYPTLKFSGQRRLATGLVLGLMGLQILFIYQICYYWGAERVAPTEFNSTRPIPKVDLEGFRQALVLNPRNSKYYLGLAETLEKRAGGEEAALREVEKSLQAAIFRAPADWNYHLQLGEFYLRRQKSAPPLYIPPALQELDAAVKLFPESGALHLRLASVLSWAEKHYPFLVPQGLRGRAHFHFQQAVKLDPGLQKYIKMP